MKLKMEYSERFNDLYEIKKMITKYNNRYKTRIGLCRAIDKPDKKYINFFKHTDFFMDIILKVDNDLNGKIIKNRYATLED